MTKRIPVLLSAVLALGGCAEDEAAIPDADQVPQVEPPAEQVESTRTTIKIGPEDPAARGSRIEMSLEGNTITSAGAPDLGGASAIDIVVGTTEPLSVRLAVAKELAGELFQEISAASNKGPFSLSIKAMGPAYLWAQVEMVNTSFTISGRVLDLAGRRLRISGTDLGTVESGDTIWISPDGVKVADQLRGPLPPRG